MFCCVRKPAHYGQIVTGICLENQCIQSENQLCCIECATHEHENHEIISIKNYIPELLKAQKQKLSYMQELKNLLTFVNDQCENQQSLLTFGGASQLSVMNIVEACKVMIKDLKSKKDQDQKKIRDIQKTLQIKGMKSNSPVKSQINFHERKASEGFYSAVRMGSESPNFKSNFHHLPASISQLGFDPIDTFSHTLKHPYISVTSDSRSITKSSAVNGYKLACLSASKLHDSESLQPILVKVKVDKSGGHLMLGLAHAENVKEKQYMNCYGIGQGSYIIGQNGNDPKSAILFHHSNSMYNRKEIVGWNYKEGDVLGIGIMKQNGVSFAVFRKFAIEKGKLDLKKVDKEYTMPIMNPQKHQALGPLYLLVLLQNMNDQVSILPEEE